MNRLTNPGDEVAALQRESTFLRELLSLGSQEELTPLLERALDSIVQMTRAEKGYLELVLDRDKDPGQGQTWSAARDCTEDEVDKIRERISSGIISEAMAGGKTIETPSAMSDSRFRDRKSVRAHKIEAVLCAPVGDPPIGVVYLQGRTISGQFAGNAKEWAELFAQQLAPLADRLLSHERQRTESDPTRKIRQDFHCPGILGRSQSLARVLRTASNVAGLNIDVLITGPSGTGKTALARAIHQNSQRSEGRFVDLNCAAIPENLFESELFGAEAGAHSTAMRAKEGKVAAAEGGTLFLDEIAELSLGSQAKLLQLLQAREYYPLGASSARKANVRIISATNAELDARVKEGHFREDLFYRLNVVPLAMPALADRLDDISILAEHLCRLACERMGLPAFQISRAALAACHETPWPGNIRELGNAIQKAVIHARSENSETLEPRHLFPDDAARHNAPLTLQDAMRRYQGRFVSDALASNDWNVTKTALQLGIARSHVYNLIKAHGLTRE